MDKLVSIFREVFQDKNIEWTGELVIKEMDNWDSFNNINLIIALEDVFSIVLTPEEVDSIQTSGDLLQVLKKKGCQI